ncbi:MAG: hypothetical protein Q7O66_16025 [Dehalococcoidia bacterium]|nr:hypothetical protein [Dehalococcoidia bacterium]
MDRGKAICDELKKAGINHLVWLTCSATHFMHKSMLSDPDFKVIPVCREAEGVGICVGLHLGGKRTALIVENAGIFDSGNGLSWVAAWEIPMVMIVGYIRRPPVPAGLPPSRLGLNRDYTESFLSFFGINSYPLDSDEDVKNVALAGAETQRTRQPVALLVTDETYVPNM